MKTVYSEEITDSDDGFCWTIGTLYVYDNGMVRLVTKGGRVLLQLPLAELLMLRLRN
jgi:hypothetical protein